MAPGPSPGPGRFAGRDGRERGELETSLELRRVSTAMVDQARRSLRIVSRHLDPAIYDTPEFVAAIKRFVLQQRRARVHLLVMDPTPIVKNGHRLHHLARRLSSFIELRVTAPEHADYLAAFMVMDEVGVIWRPFADRFEADFSFADVKLARDLADTFDQMWSIAGTHADLREMTL